MMLEEKLVLSKMMKVVAASVVAKGFLLLFLQGFFLAKKNSPNGRLVYYSKTPFRLSADLNSLFSPPALEKDTMAQKASVNERKEP